MGSEEQLRGRPIFRFAPSPNGPLHLGHAYSALLNFDLARESGGRFLLRIEDIDFGRSRAEFETVIYEDLRWLGIEWEEPVWRQSERAEIYRAALDQLDSLGLLYPCFATRAEIAKAAASDPDIRQDPDGAPIYPGLWRDAESSEIAHSIKGGAPHALRIDMAQAVALARKKAGGAIAFTELDEAGYGQRVESDPAAYGDVVIARKEFPASYHLAVVVDDGAQGVTHVVRGRDLYYQTGIHRLLQILLGLPEPKYRHHRLILASNGRKLSKSSGDESLAALRQRGKTIEDVRRATRFQ